MSVVEEIPPAKEEVSVFSAELAAQSALQQYHSNVCGKLLGEALVESSDLATAALEELTQAHTRTVEQLNAQIIGLQKELFDAVSFIEKMGGHAVGNKDTSSDFLPLAPPPVLRRSFVVDVPSNQQEKRVSENTQEHADARGSRSIFEGEERQQDEEGCKQRSSSVGEAVSDGFLTAQSCSCSMGGALLADGDTSNSAFVAEALHSRATMKLQQQQQMSLLTQLKELTALLAKAVKENTTYRKEIQMLRATSVPVEEHLQLLKERDALEQECNSMKVEMRRLETELEMALSFEPATQPQEGSSALISSLFQKEAPEVLPDVMLPLTLATEAVVGASAHGSGAIEERVDNSAHGNFVSRSKLVQTLGENELQHTGLWKTAIRELEQQATLAATQLSAAERLREAEEEIEGLKALNTELRTSLEKLEAEDQCVRSDCEHLTFRNAVLSQQVASLLVRIEQQRRALERQGRQIQQESLVYEEGDESISDSEILLEGEEPSDKTRSRRRQGCVALAAQALLERRGVVSAFAPQSTEGGPPSETGSLLDVTLRPVGSVEVEGGVRTGLDVFARSLHRPRRSVALRNMGFRPLEADVRRVPRLPPTDELSGVALGRGPQFATIDLTRDTAGGQSKGLRDHHHHHHLQNQCSTAGSINERSDNKSSGSFARTTVFSDNSEENRNFLEILREDENLDRYSINSVAELLKRNQELLRQLYVVTQRAEFLEEQLQQKEEKESNVVSETRPTLLGPKVNRKRKREELIYKLDSQEEEEEEQLEGCRKENTLLEHGLLNSKNLLSENSVSEKSLNDRHIRNNFWRQKEEEQRESNTREDVDKQLLQLEMESRYHQMEDHIDDHIETVLQKHAAHLTLTDNSLAASLLRILEVGRKNDDDDDDDDGSGKRKSFFSNNGKKNSDAVSSAMKDAVIAGFVRLCTEQGLRAANQAVTLAATLQSKHEDVIKKCWDEAQVLLRGSASELKMAVDSLPQVICPVSGDSLTKTTADTVSRASNNAGGNMYDETQLLHNIASLLRTASLKEHTVQRVLQLAARQQRLVSRIGAKRRLEDEKETLEGEGGAEDGKEDSDDILDDDDFFDEEYKLKRLIARINEMQTRYDELLAAYHEERKQHTVILDQVWRLEEEKVEALKSRDEALERMETMMTREDYEATIDALDTTKAYVEELEAKLHSVQDSSKQQLMEIDRWRLMVTELERRLVEDATAAAAQIGEKDSFIAQHMQHNYELQKSNSDKQQVIFMLEAHAAQHRAEVEGKEEEINALRKQLRRVELTLLEQQCTQDILFAIFPGDRALVENRNLIQVMRSEKEKLAEKATALQLALDEAHRQLEALRLQIHGAEQARQEAELRLQEAGFASTVAATSVPHLLTAPTTTTTITTGTAEQMSPGVATSKTTATVTKDSEAIIELEMLRHANVSLLLEKQQWMEREVLLREQLEALSHDPVSRNARRYGLKATESFEGQLAELHERCLALKEQVAAAEGMRDTIAELKDEVERQEMDLVDTKNALAAQQKCNEALSNKLSDIEQALHEKEESHDAVKLTLAEKEEMINDITGAITTLEDEGKKMVQRLQASEQERKRLYEDNIRLIDTVSGLTEEVKKKEAERKAAQTALAQGLALARTSSHRLRSRSGGQPTSITSSLNKTMT